MKKSTRCALTGLLTTLAAAAVLLAARGLSAASPAATGNAAIQQPTCKDCHTCAKPTESKRCLKPCPRLFAARVHTEHSLTEAPDMLQIDKIADQYNGAKFDHKSHASMEEMGQGCAVCHHYSPPGKIPPCESCHAKSGKSADLRQPSLKGAYHRQCMQCHREWSHETNCNICHLPKGTTAAKPSGRATDGTDVMGKAHPVATSPDKRVYTTSYDEGPTVTFHHKQHVELFGVKCASCHRNENCSSCHDLSKPTARKLKVEHDHGMCTGCHDADNCAKCHDSKERPAFTHTGWPLSSHHATLGCRACHPTEKPFAKLNRECTACHRNWKQGTFRHAVTGLELDQAHAGMDCTDCHAKGKFSQPPNCTGCHDDGRNAKSKPPGKRVDRK